MMKFGILSLLIAGMAIAGCSKEDTLVVEEYEQYTFPSNPTNEREQYIYDFFQEYNCLIIPEPDVSTYQYNFRQRNYFYLLKTDFSDDAFFFDMMEYVEYCFGVYDDNFLKKYLPFSIQFADSICPINSNTGEILYSSYYDFYVSSNFVMFGQMTKEKLAEMTAEEKRDYAIRLNAEYWYKYIEGYREAYRLDKEFWDMVEGPFVYIGRVSDMTEENALDLLHQKGYLVWHPTAYTNSKQYRTPYENDDIKSWYSVLFSMTKDEFVAKYGEYPLLMERYNLLTGAVKKDMNYEFKPFDKI